MSFFDFVKSLLSLSSLSTEVTKVVPECPNCTVELASQRIEEAEFHRCPGCHGLWLTEDAFGELLEMSPEAIHPITGQVKGQHTFSRSPQSRVCPNCENAMDNYQFYYDSGIWLDACPGGHGIWLDEGELTLCRLCKEAVDAEMSGKSLADELLLKASTRAGHAEKL